MELVKKNIENKVQFWGGLGPYVILLTLFTVLLRFSSANWYLIFPTLIAVPVCWRWGYRGLYSALGVLLLFDLLFYQRMFQDGLLWSLGITFASGIGIVITMLCLEEVKGIVKKLELESQSRMENLLQLDEKLKNEHDLWLEKEKEFKEALNDKNEEISQSFEEVNSLKSLINVLKEELEGLQDNKKTLIENGFKKTKENQILKNEVLVHKEREERLSSLLKSDESSRIKNYESNLLDLKGDIKKKEDLIDKLHEETLVLKSLSQGKEKSIIEFEKGALNLNSVLEEKTLQIHQLNKEILNYQDEYSTLKKELNGAVSLQTNQEVTIKAKESEIQRQLGQVSIFTKEVETLKEVISENQEQLKNVENQCSVLSATLKSKEESWFRKESELTQRIEKRDQSLSSKEQDILSLSQIVKEKEKDLRELKIDNKHLVEFKEQEIKSSSKKTAHFDEENQKLLKKLNEARIELYQLNLDKEDLAEKVLHTKGGEDLLKDLRCLVEGEKFDKENTELPKDILDEIKSINELRGKYKQLREQFEEKKNILSRARKEVFELESKTLYGEKQIELQKLDRENELKCVEKDLYFAVEEKDQLEDEVKGLHDIISSLMSEVKKKKSTKSKEKVKTT